MDELAEGTTRVSVAPPDDSPLLPRLPDNLEIRAGELTQVEIPLEPGVPVRGLVHSRDGKPVPNALISVRYGVHRQGRRCEPTLRDVSQRVYWLVLSISKRSVFLVRTFNSVNHGRTR